VEGGRFSFEWSPALFRIALVFPVLASSCVDHPSRSLNSSVEVAALESVLLRVVAAAWSHANKAVEDVMDEQDMDVPPWRIAGSLQASVLERRGVALLLLSAPLALCCRG